jgi:hypothetical protein
MFANAPAGRSGALMGVVPALVTAIRDPRGMRHELGCVRVRFPWLQSEDDPSLIQPWARIVRAGATKSSGWSCFPDVGDEVLVAFEHGDIEHPYVIGSLWNGKAKAPTTESPEPEAQAKDRAMPAAAARSKGVRDGKPDSCMIRSPSGHVIILDDSSATATICDASGQAVVELGKSTINIVQAAGDVNIYAAKTISMECTDFKLKAMNSIRMEAVNGTCEVESKDRMALKTKANLDVSALKNIQVGAKMNVVLKSDRSVSLTGQAGFFAGTLGNATINAKGNVTTIAEKSIDSRASGDNKIRAGKGAVEVKSGANFNVTAGGNIALNGAQVLMNGPPIPPPSLLAVAKELTLKIADSVMSFEGASRRS